VVQAGCYGEVLGEVQVVLHADGTRDVAATLHPVDDSILGDPRVEAEVEKLSRRADELLFEPDGLRIDQPLAVATGELSNSFTDLERSAPLANLVTDAFRAATGADVALTVNGLIRAGLRAGAHGLQTVYDVFALTPIGEGVDEVALGTHLVTVPLTVAGLVDLIELLLADTPRRPGRHVPRTSGFRYGYDPDAARGARLRWCELGDATTGVRAVDLDDPTPLVLALPANLRAIASRADAPLARALDDLIATASRPDPPVREWEAVVRWLRSRPRPAGSLLPELPEPGSADDQRVVAQATSSQP
jgi:5'-nucleotidase